MAGRATTVIDASVATKWFLQEEHSEPAAGLRDAHVRGLVRLLAPSLIVYEVSNVLRYHPRVGSELLADHIADLLALDLGLDPPSEEAIREAVRLAYRAGITVYDAAYVALAQRFDCPLVTADAQQLAAAGSRGTHIKDWIG